MIEARPQFSRWAGTSLILAGILFLVVGAITASLPLDDKIREEPAFLWRQSIAIAVALLLLFGAIGIYARHPGRGSISISLVCALAVIGSAFLVGHEWQELFLARDLATQSPEAFARLENAPGLTPFDWGALIAVSTFTIGWIGLAGATLIGGAFSRWGGLLVIGGMFGLPLLTAALGAPIGPLLGSAILAAGFVRLGLDLVKAPARSS